MQGPTTGSTDHPSQNQNNLTINNYNFTKNSNNSNKFKFKNISYINHMNLNNNIHCDNTNNNDSNNHNDDDNNKDNNTDNNNKNFQNNSNSTKNTPQKQDHQQNMLSFQLAFKKRHKHLAYGQNYIPQEETIRNDYSLHYVLTGFRPQNQIHNTALFTRFAEYPKLKKLLQLKKSQVSTYCHPPMYIQADLRPAPYPNSFNLLDLLPTRFDVIVLDPPLEEYVRRYPHLAKTSPNILKSGGALHQERAYWTWDELENLPIPSIAASPGFIFLWCGSGQGSTLEFGRSLLSKWGYRKCEDLVWVKTNHHHIQSNAQLDWHLPHHSSVIQSDQNHETSSISAVFSSSKEHCLMGIRGTVRRSTDGHFVHCNVDTDVIVSEPDPNDVLHKPEELYQLIENFCLGRRRLDLFGSRKTLRPGWLTIGSECEPNTVDSAQTPVNQVPIRYEKLSHSNFFFDHSGRTQNLLPTDADIDNLRPRSPPVRIAPALASPGMALPHAHGYSPKATPMIGPDGTILRNTIGGRNTLSHPSGGLGRGPGNALLPGMRVSGSRDSNQARVMNQMGFHPTSVHSSLDLNLTSPQLPPSAHPLTQSQPQLNLTTRSHGPIQCGNPATAHPTHQQHSTSMLDAYPTPAHPSVYHRSYSVFPLPSAQGFPPYYPTLLPDHYYPQQLPTHIAYPHHQFPVRHFFPAPRQFPTHRSHLSQHSLLSNAHLSSNHASNARSLNPSSSSPLVSPPFSTSRAPSSRLYRH